LGIEEVGEKWLLVIGLLVIGLFVIELMNIGCVPKLANTKRSPIAETCEGDKRPNAKRIALNAQR
jgi:hypothetical protein